MSEVKEVKNATEQTRIGTPAWKRQSKGVPVEKGKNWVTGLTHEQRCQAMYNHEMGWKAKYNANKGTLMQNWSRG